MDASLALRRRNTYIRIHLATGGNLESKQLSVLQGYFVIALVTMHILYGGAYFLSDTRPNAVNGETTKIVSTVETDESAKAGTLNSPKTEAQDLPLPPEAGHLVLDKLSIVNRRYEVPMKDGWHAELTLDHDLQTLAEKVLSRGRVPAGAIVAIDLGTSEVLALAQRVDKAHPVAPPHDQDAPSHFALRRTAPSASVFKLVTSAALLEAGLNPAREMPYRPAKRRITKRHLRGVEDGPRANLASAIATSNNGYFAIGAQRLLTPGKLHKMAVDFGFNRPVQFAVEVEPSLATVPPENLEVARMAAGFWHSYLTPLHAAVIVSTIANGGENTTPRLVKSLHHKDGITHLAPSSSPAKRILSPAHAEVIERGLRRTVTRGTARNAFGKWPAKLQHVKVFGKTGTLGAVDPARTYTWFVGYTRNAERDIAIAVLAINGDRWWRKAPQLAMDFLKGHALDGRRIARRGLER